jgi:hypothetical protein
MSLKNGIMDRHFKLYNLKIHLKCNSLEPDTIDIFSLLDDTLHFNEDIRNIDHSLKISHNHIYHRYL